MGGFALIFSFFSFFDRRHFLNLPAILRLYNLFSIDQSNDYPYQYAFKVEDLIETERPAEKKNPSVLRYGDFRDMWENNIPWHKLQVLSYKVRSNEKQNYKPYALKLISVQTK